MKVLKSKYKIKANIDHVFNCHRDLDFACTIINKFKNTNEIRALRKGDEIHLVSPGNKVTGKEIESITPSFLKMEFSSTSKKLKWFGTVIANCEFTTSREMTAVTVEYFSDKNPGLFWKVFIRLISKVLNFQARKYEKQFIEEIERCA